MTAGATAIGSLWEAAMETCKLPVAVLRKG